jgi:hypothetical protein
MAMNRRDAFKAAMGGLAASGIEATVQEVVAKADETPLAWVLTLSGPVKQECRYRIAAELAEVMKKCPMELPIVVLSDDATFELRKMERHAT